MFPCVPSTPSASLYKHSKCRTFSLGQGPARSQHTAPHLVRVRQRQCARSPQSAITSPLQEGLSGYDSMSERTDLNMTRRLRRMLKASALPRVGKAHSLRMRYIYVIHALCTLQRHCTRGRIVKAMQVLLHGTEVPLVCGTVCVVCGPTWDGVPIGPVKKCDIYLIVQACTRGTQKSVKPTAVRLSND